MLGFEDKDFDKIDLSLPQEDIYFQEEILNTIDVERTNCSIIYVVRNSIRNYQLSNQKHGNIKWLIEDTVKSIYFKSKREERKVVKPIINPRLRRSLKPITKNLLKRQKRQAQTKKIKYTETEKLETVILETDNKETKLRKVTNQGIWDIRANKLSIGWCDPNDVKIDKEKFVKKQIDKIYSGV